MTTQLDGFVFVRWMDEATHECIRDDGLRKWADAAFASNTFVARSVQEAQQHIVNCLIGDAQEAADEDDTGDAVPTPADFRWEWDEVRSEGLVFQSGDAKAYASVQPLALMLVQVGGPC